MTADADQIETPRAFRAQAVLAGSGIDLSALGATDRTGGAPLVVELIGTLTGARLPDGTAAGGVAVLFRYGAVVFFDFPDSTYRIQHVGLVTAVNGDGTVNTIEGNTSTVYRRDGVAAKYRARDSWVTGFVSLG
jgi:hypothetical protein